MMHQPGSSRRGTCSFGMLELLVAVLILSIAICALAGLGAHSARQDAFGEIVAVLDWRSAGIIAALSQASWEQIESWVELEGGRVSLSRLRLAGESCQLPEGILRSTRASVTVLAVGLVRLEVTVLWVMPSDPHHRERTHIWQRLVCRPGLSLEASCDP